MSALARCHGVGWNLGSFESSGMWPAWRCLSACPLFSEKERKSKVVPGRDLYCACYVSLPLFHFFFKIVFIDEILYPIPPPTSCQYPSEITPVSWFITPRAPVSPHLFPWCLILCARGWLKETGTWSFSNDSVRMALACQHVPPGLQSTTLQLNANAHILSLCFRLLVQQPLVG